MEFVPLDFAIIALLLIISGVAIATRPLRLPYPIALVIAGLLIGALIRQPLPFLRDLPLEQITLTPHLILVLFLPALLFEASLHIEASRLRRWLLPITVLAVPGVLITAGIVGVVLHWLVGIDWLTAMLFGAIVSATDPIAVIAIFKRLGAPHDLELIVEGESLFNDGTAIVLSRILLGAVLAGRLSPAGGLVDFVVVVGGGLLVGYVAGRLATRVIATIDDHLIEITLTTILAYGTYLTAEVTHVSGVIAVVTAGLVLGNVGTRSAMSPTTRLALLNFWEYIAFLINSAIFLLIGLQVRLEQLVSDIVPIGVAVLGTLLARAVVVYGLGVVVLSLPPALPRMWLHTIFWSGMRGALSLAVVLSLPIDLAGRPLLFNLAFGVVLFTLLVQGLTIEPLLRRLGLVRQDPQQHAYRVRRAQLLLQRSAVQELERLEESAVLGPRVAATLARRYEQAGALLRGELETIYQERAALEGEEMRRAREHLLYVERTRLQELQRQGLVDSAVANELAEAIDARLLALQNEEISTVDNDAPAPPVELDPVSPTTHPSDAA